MESHTHPPYEQTFQRIATILDGLAEAKTDQAKAHSRLTEAIEKFATKTGQALERLAIKSAETEDKLNALITLMDQHINEHHRKN